MNFRVFSLCFFITYAKSFQLSTTKRIQVGSKARVTQYRGYRGENAFFAVPPVVANNPMNEFLVNVYKSPISIEGTANGAARLIKFAVLSFWNAFSQVASVTGQLSQSSAMFTLNSLNAARKFIMVKLQIIYAWSFSLEGIVQGMGHVSNYVLMTLINLAHITGDIIKYVQAGTMRLLGMAGDAATSLGGMAGDAATSVTSISATDCISPMKVGVQTLCAAPGKVVESIKSINLEAVKSVNLDVLSSQQVLLVASGVVIGYGGAMIVYKNGKRELKKATAGGSVSVLERLKKSRVVVMGNRELFGSLLMPWKKRSKNEETKTADDVPSEPLASSAVATKTSSDANPKDTTKKATSKTATKKAKSKTTAKQASSKTATTKATSKTEAKESMKESWKKQWKIWHGETGESS